MTTAWLKATKPNINKTLEMPGSASSSLSLISSFITVSLDVPLPPSAHHHPPNQAKIMDHTELFIDEDSQRSSSPHWAPVHSHVCLLTAYEKLRVQTHSQFQQNEQMSTQASQI